MKLLLDLFNHEWKFDVLNDPKEIIIDFEMKEDLVQVCSTWIAEIDVPVIQIVFDTSEQ